jgi:hypothetical protein
MAPAKHPGANARVHGSILFMHALDIDVVKDPDEW